MVSISHWGLIALVLSQFERETLMKQNRWHPPFTTEYQRLNFGKLD